ncbi:aminoglycoside phosphotransferase family protein [Konateibacter massiliensis]|uniref:aminoglycoside phosphotransferase family protein n=1 Tax=Konateibacter massiliensis TaxID=2002841 RepID=UPI000C14970F|nr:aminoglycoside phosphotransferase family protein [Konateibacter massiliensis]
MEQQFKKERVLIGQGKMAKVYLWNGFAYKCFDKDYPEDWIAYEMKIQTTINQLRLPTVKYYSSEISHSIKMDYISGITLADRVRKEKYKNGLEDLFSIFFKIHQKGVTNLPRLNPFLLKSIEMLNVEDAQKERAIEYISDIADDDILCHLDYHFLNLMYTEDGYCIIDWVNAKIGNPIYDFARTYVILYEYANRLSKKYLNMIKAHGEFDTTDLQKAIYVMALHRLSERSSEKINQLILFNNVLT